MKKILSIFTVLFTALTFGQNVDPFLQPNSSLTSGQWNKGTLQVDGDFVLPTTTNSFTNPSLRDYGKLRYDTTDSIPKFHNGERWKKLQAMNFSNASFVNKVAAATSIQSAYLYKMASIGEIFSVGFIMNGEAVQYNFLIDADGFMRFNNTYANVVSGGVMQVSGREKLTTGILEFAVKAKKSGQEIDFDWIPAHGASTGALEDIVRTIYVDGNETDIESLTNGTIVIVEDFVIHQTYTCYSPNDALKLYPLFNGTTIHKLKDGKLTISNDLIALTDLDVNNAFSAKLSGYPEFTDKILFDNGVVYQTTSDNGDYALPYPCKSLAFFSDTGKYVMAIEVGDLFENTNFDKDYTDKNYLRLWDRNTPSVYWNWSKFFLDVDGEEGGFVVVPEGERFRSTNTITISTNTNNIIR